MVGLTGGALKTEEKWGYYYLAALLMGAGPIGSSGGPYLQGRVLRHNDILDRECRFS